MGFSLVAEGRGYSLVVVCGFLTAVASLFVALECLGFSSCGSQPLEHRLNSGAAWAWLLCDKWDLPRPGIKT